MRFCDLPGCRAQIPNDTPAEIVRVIFDHRSLIGIACTPAHAAELERGWKSRDAFGAEFAAVGA